jgi:hypothetical protein
MCRKTAGAENFLLLQKKSIMIQRKQTIFLLIATFFTAILFFSDMADITLGNDFYNLVYKGIVSSQSGLPIMFEPQWPMDVIRILISLFVLLSAAIILLYKKRKLQIWLCIPAMIINATIPGFIYYYARMISQNTGAECGVNLASFLPAIGLVFIVLAMKAIKKDENLLKSLNRIR